MPRSLRVVHVSAHDASGGAGRACFNLHTALKRLGHQSTIFAAHVTSDDPDVVAFDPPGALGRRPRLGHVRKRGARPEGLVGYGFTEDRSRFGAATVKQIPPADVVNLHWFGGFLDFTALFDTVPARAPVVWSMHDMNGFTGGCHFDAGCGRFLHRCGACPQLASTAERDRSRAVWERKHAALADVGEEQLTVVAPSRSFAAEVARSSLLGRFPATAIRYSVDTEVFRPRDRAHARAALGIAPDAAVVGFVADSLVTRRKGFAFVDAALGLLEGLPRPLLLSVGANDPGISSDVRRVHLDPVADDELLAQVYSAMDVLLVPSLQESMGFTALEALACERPVVAFRAGPLPEMVRPGETGELVPFGDVRSLAEATAALLCDPQRRTELGRAGRRLVVEECSYEVQAERYVEIYRSLLGARAG